MGHGGVVVVVSILHCVFQPLGPEPIPLAFGVLMGRGYSPCGGHWGPRQDGTSTYTVSGLATRAWWGHLP